MRGHKKEGCFRIVGYPDSWKQSKTKGRETAATTYNMSNDEDDTTGIEDYKMYKLFLKNMNDLKSKEAAASYLGAGKYFEPYKLWFGSFSKNTRIIDNSLKKSKEWILDSGASCHASNNLKQFSSINDLKPPRLVYLADGSHKKFKKQGQ